MAQQANAQVFQYYWKDNANNGNWDWGGSQWFGTQTNSLVGAPNYNGGAQVYFENLGNTNTTINAGGGTGGAPSGWIGLNAIFTQNASTGKVYTINSGAGINGIYLYNKIETLNIGTAAGLTINSQVQLGGTAEINAVAANIQLGNLLFNGQTLNSFGNKQLNITGVMSGSGAYNIKNQGITVTYSGNSANTFSGTTTVENTSTLVLNKSANTAAIAGSLVVNSGAIVRTDAANQLSNQLVTVNGTLNLNNNNQSAALAGAGSVTLGSGTLTINNTATDTFSGNISGTGGVIKTGAGTQILSNANTYGGNTTISGGTLTLGTSGTFANSPNIVVGDTGSSGTVLDLTAKSSFVFGANQTVKGIGNINIGAGKTVTINGTLAKGNSIGTQTYTGNLVLAGNDNIELGNSTGAGTYANPYNSDLGIVSGNITLGGTLNVINNAGADGNGNISAGSYKIYTYGGTAGGSYATINNATGYRADIVDNGAGTGSGQGIYLDNYQVAAAASTQTVTLNTRTGVSASTSLTLNNTNNATPTFQETLGSTGFSGTTAGFTASGSVTGIAGGASGSGTLSVGVIGGTVGTAGTYSGSTTLGLQTEAVNSSGLGNAAIGSQTVTINVNAYDFASADFTHTGGAGSLTGGGVSYTLDFGTGLALNTSYTATLQLANGLFSPYKDSLGNGTYGTVGGPFSETANNFVSLASGDTDTFTITFNTGSAGTFNDVLTFNGTSLNTPLGNSALSQVNIAITAQAIPEPRAALLGGLGLLALLRRRRR